MAMLVPDGTAAALERLTYPRFTARGQPTPEGRDRMIEDIAALPASSHDLTASQLDTR